MEGFSFVVPVDLIKSRDAETHEEIRLIRGYASTEAQDRQDETLVQKGLDISDFVNHGYFNYDHDNSIIMGYPTENCHIDEKGFWVEGILLKGIPQADRMWELAKALKKSNAPRKLGFSVEGKVLERQGNRITKAKIYHVALTASPVNTTCSWDAIVKSFNAPEPVSTIDKVSKALEAGYETNPSDMEGGEVLKKESLSDSLKNLSYVIDDEEKKKLLKEQMANKSLTHNELVAYLQIAKGWSKDQADSFISKQKL